MNLNHLYYFRALAKEEHYTRTADMLSITQPSLSHAISCLESELGVKLFEKQGRNAKLTKYGALFLRYVEQSLDMLDEGKRVVTETSGTSGGFIDMAEAGADQKDPEKIYKFDICSCNPAHSSIV